MSELSLLSDIARKKLEQHNQSYQKIEPVNSGLVKKPDDKDHNFWTTLGDMALSIPQGVVNAIEEQGDFLEENIISIGGIEFGDNDGKLSFKDFIPRYVRPEKWKSEERQLVSFHKPETMAGNVTEGISRFITGFAGPAKFLKGAGLAGGAVKTSLRGFTAGAVADLTVFDPNEGRLSDMLVEFDSPLLNNAVTQYLATDENDSEMQGRLKNVLEGMALGGIAETILYGIRGYKKMKATKNLEERAKIQEETAKVIQDSQQGKKTKRLKKFALNDNPAIDTNQALKIIKTAKETAKQDSELWIKKVLNTKSFKSGFDVLKTIDDVADNVFDDVTKEYLESDVLANEVAEELATVLARDKEEVLKSVIKEGQTSKDGTVRMLATKQILQQLAVDLQETSGKYLSQFGDDSSKWSAEALQEVSLRSKVIAETFYALKEQIRGAARVTQAGRIKVTKSGGKILDIEEISNIFETYNPNPAVVAKKIKGMKPEDIINQVSKSKKAKVIEVFNSLYINSLLSGVFTHAVNIKSGLYEAIIRPLELIAGGAVRADTKAIKLGWSQYKGMMMHFGDALKMTSLALRQGDAILDPLARTQDNLQVVGGKAIRPISGSNLGFSGASGKMIDWFGNIIELPTRMLMTGDEFLKQINYRGRMLSNAIDNTMELGFDISSKEGKANIEKIFNEGFDKNGRANIEKSPFAKDALQYARESTYTNDLKGGSHLDWGYKIQKFLNSTPEFRFLMPFIRTPTNLWRHVSNRIPGAGLFTKQNMDLWKSGDRRARAEVLGRQFVGSAAVLYAFDLAFDEVEDKFGNKFPKITGAGPKDFNIKKIWLQNGWQDYSIAQKNDDGTITYKQYNRMDPRFYIYGIVADIKENIFENINDEDKQDIITAGAISIFRNAANKSYLRGVSDAATVIANPTSKNISKYFGNIAGNVIPYASFRSQGVPNAIAMDKDIFETRSFTDKILAKLDLGEKFLEKKRDVLTGKPIERVPNALYFNPNGVASLSTLIQGPSLVGKKVDIKSDPVLTEIMSLRVSLREPQIIKDKIVDLTEYKKNGQSAYDFWMENIGKVKSPRGKFRGLNLKEAIASYIKTNEYQRLQQGNENFEGGKEFVIKKIFQAYKDLAENEMYKQYPEVYNKLIQVKREKFGLKLPKRQESEKRINELLLK